MKTAAPLLLLLVTLNLRAADIKPVTREPYPNKDSQEASAYRGSLVFKTYCVLCHGVKADGNGRAARLYTPRPANLVLSDKNAQYKELIIRRGGAALGRSPFMPPWGQQLTDEQVTDVVAYLGTVLQKAPD